MANVRLHTSELANLFQEDGINFITRSSFESRWTPCLNSVKNCNIKTLTILRSENQSNEAKNTYKLLDEKTLKLASLVSLPKSKPEETYRTIRATLENNLCFDNSELNAIDISSFKREELFIIILILKDLFEKHPSMKCRFLYNEVDSMNEDWLSRNTSKIRTILGYSGDPKQSKRTCVISMIGHEINRAKDIIDAYDPSKLMIGRGMNTESINTNLCKRNEVFYKELSSYYGDECSKFEFSLLDPIKVKNLLIELCSDEDYNYVISPLNNKISCIGASLFALENQDIQVCYSQMLEYNRPSYSKPSEYAHIIDMEEYFK